MLATNSADTEKALGEDYGDGFQADQLPIDTTTWGSGPALAIRICCRLVDIVSTVRKSSICQILRLTRYRYKRQEVNVRHMIRCI